MQLGGKRGKRIALARANQDVVRSEISTARLNLRSDVRRTYTRLYNAQQRQTTYEDILASNQQLVQVARKRYKAGAIPEVDVMQAELAAVQAENNAQNAFGDSIQTRNSLNILLNKPLSSNLKLISPAQSDISREGVGASQSDLERLVQQALSQRPELQGGISSLVVAERQLDLAKANRIPDITLAAGPDLVVEQGAKELNVFLLGSIDIPLFDRQQGPILEALARRVQVEKEQAALKNRIFLEVTNAYSGYELNRQRLIRYETEILPKAQILVEKSRRSFEVGKSNILFPINAQQAYQQTRLDYLQAILDYENAITDLERAVGAGL